MAVQPYIKFARKEALWKLLDIHHCPGKIKRGRHDGYPKDIDGPKHMFRAIQQSKVKYRHNPGHGESDEDVHSNVFFVLPTPLVSAGTKNKR